MSARILIAEDEPHIRQYLADILATMRDVEVVFAPNGEVAIDRLRQGEWDIVISDQRMGATDGVVVLGQAAVLVPDAQRVMITGFAELALVEEAKNGGHAHRFLAKPFSPTTFLGVIEDLLEKARLTAHHRHAFTRALETVPTLGRE